MRTRFNMKKRCNSCGGKIDLCKTVVLDLRSGNWIHKGCINAPLDKKKAGKKCNN